MTRNPDSFLPADQSFMPKPPSVPRPKENQLSPQEGVVRDQYAAFLQEDFHKVIVEYTAWNLAEIEKALIGKLSAEMRLTVETQKTQYEDLLDGRTYRKALERKVGDIRYAERAERKRREMLDQAEAEYGAAGGED